MQRQLEEATAENLRNLTGRTALLEGQASDQGSDTDGTEASPRSLRRRREAARSPGTPQAATSRRRESASPCGTTDWFQEALRLEEELAELQKEHEQVSGFVGRWSLVFVAV